CVWGDERRGGSRRHVSRGQGVLYMLSEAVYNVIRRRLSADPPRCGPAGWPWAPPGAGAAHRAPNRGTSYFLNLRSSSCRARRDGRNHPCTALMTSSTRSAARSPATAAISSTSTPPHSWDSVVKKLFDGK